MTNQMRKFLLASMLLSWASLICAVASLFYFNFSYKNVFSYVILAVNIVLVVFLTVFYFKALSDMKKYKKQIFYAKKLLELRENAILGFYKRYNIQPLYKDGKLITPDELLQIATKLDAEGKLDVSIYEVLGIDPVIGPDGKEIPIVLVLKHLIKKVKKEGLLDLSKKFKGFYLKGSKKEKKVEAKKPEKKKAPKVEKGGKKKKDKKLFGEKEEPKKKKEDKKGGKKKPSKDEKKKPENKDPKEDKKSEQKKTPEVVKLTVEEKKDIPKETKKMETFSNLFGGSREVKTNNPTKNHDIFKDYTGEFTPE